VPTHIKLLHKSLYSLSVYNEKKFN